jgi:hypothetical protein
MKRDLPVHVTCGEGGKRLDLGVMMSLATVHPDIALREIKAYTARKTKKSP